jgi:hypothetical protein
MGKVVGIQEGGREGGRKLRRRDEREERDKRIQIMLRGGGFGGSGTIWFEEDEDGGLGR